MNQSGDTQMRSVIKTLLISGVILAIVGYLVPDKFAIGSIFIIGALVGGAVFAVLSTRWSQSRVNFFLLVFFTLLTSSWASLLLFGSCNMFERFLVCSTNKVNALIFEIYFSPMLIALAAWVQQFFGKKH
jgi:drug/metabolite transporter (DMT)-like permease